MTPPDIVFPKMEDEEKMIGELALVFVTKRLGPMEKAEDPEYWGNILGCVYDAYDFLLGMGSVDKFISAQPEDSPVYDTAA